MTEPRPRWSVIFGWSSYDMASNFFAFVILTAYFPLWLKFDLGGREIHLGLANAAAMFGMIAAFPILGVLTDRFRRHVILVLVFTLLAVIPQALLGRFSALWIVLLLFGIARLGYQGAFIFYGSMLPDVAGHPSRQGRVSGLGTAFGYVGTLTAIGVMALLGVGEHNRKDAFVPSAGLYAAFSLPFFLLVADTAPVAVDLRAYLRAVPEAMRTWIRTFRDATRYREPFLFLMACFFLLDAVHTVITFMGIYMKTVLGIDDRTVIFFYVVGTTTAVFGSIGVGWLSDRLGLHRVFPALFLAWIVVFGLAARVVEPWMLWIVAPLVGICLGATWTCGRPYLMQLAPPEKRTEFFSLFGLIERLSVALGPLMWGGILLFAEDSLGTVTANRLAISSLILMALIGFLLLPTKPRTIPAPPASNA